MHGLSQLTSQIMITSTNRKCLNILSFNKFRQFCLERLGICFIYYTCLEQLSLIKMAKNVDFESVNENEAIIARIKEFIPNFFGLIFAYFIGK